MDELLEALGVAVVEELFLEIGSGRLRSGALWRRHCHIARRRGLHLTIAGWRILDPA